MRMGSAWAGLKPQVVRAELSRTWKFPHDANVAVAFGRLTDKKKKKKIFRSKQHAVRIHSTLFLSGAAAPGWDPGTAGDRTGALPDLLESQAAGAPSWSTTGELHSTFVRTGREFRAQRSHPDCHGWNQTDRQ